MSRGIPRLFSCHIQCTIVVINARPGSSDIHKCIRTPVRCHALHLGATSQRPRSPSRNHSDRQCPPILRWALPHTHAVPSMRLSPASPDRMFTPKLTPRRSQPARRRFPSSIRELTPQLATIASRQGVAGEAPLRGISPKSGITTRGCD